DSDSPYRGKPGPATFEGRSGGRHGGVDVGLVAQRDRGESLTGSWVDRLQAGSGCRPTPLSGDEHPAVDAFRLHASSLRVRQILAGHGWLEACRVPAIPGSPQVLLD